MNRIFVFTLAASAALSVAAVAAPPAQRLRGTITKLDAHSITIQTSGGRKMAVMIDAGTHFLKVEKSSLSKIDKGSYIGTATKTVGSQMIALEVVIFPAGMRGAGEGHYGWDRLPDPTAKPGTKTASTMTNGNVASVAAAAPKVASTMTNGNVAAAASRGGEKRLTVTYKGGQQTILVPTSSPIVKFRPGSRANARVGAHVFIKASETGGKPTAQIVAVGVDGVTPPM